MGKNQLDNLERIIKERYPQAQFEDGVSNEEVESFEQGKNLKIPNKLLEFYKWSNGINLTNNMYMPSLQEAYDVCNQYSLPNPDKTKIEEFDPSSTFQVEKFIDEYHDNVLWYPILIIHGESKTDILSFVETKDSHAITFNKYLPKLNIFYFCSLSQVLNLIESKLTKEETQSGFRSFINDINDFLNSL